MAMTNSQTLCENCEDRPAVTTHDLIGECCAECAAEFDGTPDDSCREDFHSDGF